eukprot:623725-Heterocapsa_arctica.AAC.1
MVDNERTVLRGYVGYSPGLAQMVANEVDPTHALDHVDGCRQTLLEGIAGAANVTNKDRRAAANDFGE